MQSLWMLAAALSFSVMALCVKLLGARYAAPEILFYRCLFSTLGLLVLLCLRSRWVNFKNWRLHLRRALLATISMGVWYFTISKLPLALAVTLNYASPIFVGILFALGRRAEGQKLHWVFFAALGLGFAGVVTLANPRSSGEQFGLILLGAVGALCAALAFGDIKKLAQAGESEMQMVFFFSLYATLFSGASLPFVQLHSHSVSGLGLLCAVALFATAGQFGVSRAYGRGHPLVAATLQYAGVVFSACWGWLFWQESLSPQAILGMAMVIGSSLMVTVLLDDFPQADPLALTRRRRPRPRRPSCEAPPRTAHCARPRWPGPRCAPPS